MKPIAIAFLAVTALTACERAPVVAQVSPNDLDVSFTCANDESLSVRFRQAQGVAILMRQGVSVELPQEPSGSGFTYSNGANTLRGKGNDLTVESEHLPPIQCKAV